MTAIPMPHLPSELPISQARDQLGQLVDRAFHTNQVVYLTRRGRRVAAIVPAAEADHLDAAREAAIAESVAKLNMWAPDSEFLAALDAEHAATWGEPAGA